MSLTQETWEEEHQKGVRGWLRRMRKAGIKNVYSFLAGMALVPVAAALGNGDWGALMALGQVVAGVGGNLLAGVLQNARDRTEGGLAKQILESLKENPALLTELDEVLGNLNTMSQAAEALTKDDRKWFLDTLRDELSQLGNLSRFEATLRGIAVGGPVQESVLITGDNNCVSYVVNQYFQAGGRRTDVERLHGLVGEYVRWARDQFATIELRGIKREGQQVMQLDLEKVYVPLSAEMPGASTEERSVDLGELLNLKAPQDLESGERQHRQQWKTATRLVVTGGPGSGKTTVLQHVAWTVATAIATDSPETARERLGLAGPLPLPVFVSLSAYAEHCRNLPLGVAPRRRTLATFISYYLIRRQAGLDLPTDFFARLLRTGQAVILLLDGLDEVPNEDERAAVRQAIHDLVTGRDDDAMRALVTCRSAAYQGATALGKRFCEVRVRPLEDEHIRSLVEHAYAAIYPNDLQSAQRKAEELLSGIDRLEEERQRRVGEDADRLVTSPLLVRMLLVVHFSERQLPEQRAELYLKATDAMLLPDYAPDAEVAHEIGRRVGGSREVHRELVQHVAFGMQRRGPSQGREVTEDELRRLLADSPTPASSADELIALTRLRGTLLEERLGTYRFIHLAFQEYLAARYLAEIVRSEDGVDGMVSFLVEGPILDSWWREPALLLAGYLSITSPQIAQMFLRRLAGVESTDDGTGSIRAPDIQLAAAEVSATAVLEWQGSSAELRRELGDQLARLFQDVELMAANPPARRAAAGDALARLGDPRFRPDAWLLPDEPCLGFLSIPGATFQMGSDKRRDGDAYGDELPQHEVELPTCYVARYPVTVAQFRAFVEDSDHAREDSRHLRGLPNHPVVNVSWHEARAYCKWLTAKLRELAAERVTESPSGRSGQDELWRGLRDGTLRVGLPSEAEWEKAARGTDARRYPWGHEPDPNRANYSHTGLHRTTAVGCFPDGASPYGCQDMAGNVWEWTRSLWGPEPGEPQFGYPYDPTDGREKTSASDEVLRVLRGGAFYVSPVNARCAYRYRLGPDVRDGSAGFRLLLSPF